MRQHTALAAGSPSASVNCALWLLGASVCLSLAASGASVRKSEGIPRFLGKGKLATSNSDQVRGILGILETLSLDVATAVEARAMLGLKGGDQVAF